MDVTPYVFWPAIVERPACANKAAAPSPQRLILRSSTYIGRGGSVIPGAA